MTPLVDAHLNVSKGSHLLWNFPQALHTAEHVAAPQHDAPNVIS